MKKAIIAVIVVLVLADLAMMIGFFLPFALNNPVAPTGNLVLQEADGGWLLSWPAAKKADFYQVTIAPQDDPDKPIYRQYTDAQPQILLPALPTDGNYCLKINSVLDFSSLFGQQRRYSNEALEVVTDFTVPTLEDFDYRYDAATHHFTTRVKLSDGALWSYQLSTQSGQLLDSRDCNSETAELSFGSSGTYPMPDLADPYILTIYPYRQDGSLSFYAGKADSILIRADWLAYSLPVLQAETLEKNSYRLSWNCDPALTSELQYRSSAAGQWKTVSDSTDGVYSVYLKAGEERRYRVAAYDEDGVEQTSSEELVLEGTDLALNSTIWPTRDLPVYASATGNDTLTTVSAGTGLWVLALENGRFGVWLPEQECMGYLDSNSCMINLPEYLGSLCSYNITNSYNSAYTIHDIPIPDVTGTIIPGYEHIYQDNGEFLVPLLYPTAQKLFQAALFAQQQGFRLKIYDAYRPGLATEVLYDRTMAILNDPLPTYTAYGIDTYGELMMGGGGFSLNSFLAKGTSMHNLGLALDLTLEDENGKDLVMQATIHDLSCYAAQYRNNDNAKRLWDIMTSAGFGDLSTEWWHFQDNDAKNTLSPVRVQNGFTGACWIHDNIGWRYRTDSGSFYSNGNATIGQKTYHFDASGYIAGQP